MKKDPPAEKGTSATVAVRVTINGTVYEMTKAEATKLRDQLSAAVGEKVHPFEQYRRQQREGQWPGGGLLFAPREMPGRDQFQRGPSTPIPNPYEVTCTATQLSTSDC